MSASLYRLTKTRSANKPRSNSKTTVKRALSDWSHSNERKRINTDVSHPNVICPVDLEIGRGMVSHSSLHSSADSVNPPKSGYLSRLNRLNQRRE